MSNRQRRRRERRARQRLANVGSQAKIPTKSPRTEIFGWTGLALIGAVVAVFVSTKTAVLFGLLGVLFLLIAFHDHQWLSAVPRFVKRTAFLVLSLAVLVSGYNDWRQYRQS